MARIHIERSHPLPLSQARKIALKWAAQAQEKYGVSYRYQEGQASDQLHFSRAGVSGMLILSSGHFTLTARLGLLLSAFHAKIESELVSKLDRLIAQTSAPPQQPPPPPPPSAALN